MMRNASLVFAAAVIALVGCRQESVREPKSADAAKVTLDVPKKKTMHRIVEQPATVEAFEETPLIAHIAGYVEKVYVDIESRVEGPRFDTRGNLKKPGTVLAELSAPEVVREWEQKVALVDQAKAEVDQAKAALEAADAQIQTSRALVREATAACGRADAAYERWKTELARLEELVKDKVVDRQIRDETLHQFKSAEANRSEVEAKVLSAQAMVAESEAKRKKAKADVDAAKARVQVAVAQEGQQKAMVDYRFIHAPFDGVVTRRNVHTGHFLQPGPATLFIVARTDKLRIVADIPEADAGYIAKDVTGKVRFPVLKDQGFDAKVARTSQTLDPKTRTLRVEIDHADKDTKVRPGMWASIVFTIDLGERWTLPASAIFTQGDQPCVWRVVDGKAVRTPVKLGARDGQIVEVVQMQKGSTWESPSNGDEVAVSGLGAISEGKEVRGERK